MSLKYEPSSEPLQATSDGASAQAAEHAAALQRDWYFSAEQLAPTPHLAHPGERWGVGAGCGRGRGLTKARGLLYHSA